MLTQLKYSVLHPGTRWTAARLSTLKRATGASVVKRLAQLFARLGEEIDAEERLSKVTIALVSNQPIDPELEQALDAARGALRDRGPGTYAGIAFARLPVKRRDLLDKLRHASRLSSGDFTDLVRVLDLQIPPSRQQVRGHPARSGMAPFDLVQHRSTATRGWGRAMNMRRRVVLGVIIAASVGAQVAAGFGVTPTWEQVVWLVAGALLSGLVTVWPGVSVVSRPKKPGYLTCLARDEVRPTPSHHQVVLPSRDSPSLLSAARVAAEDAWL